MFTFPIYNKEMTDPLPVLVVGIKKYTLYSYNLCRENSVLLQIIIYYLQYQRDARLERIFGMF